MSISDFLELMPHTIQYHVFVGRDSYAKPTYALPTSYRARVLYKQRFVQRPDGSMVLARGFAWLAADSFVSQSEDKLTLPDGSEPPILFAETVPDESGTHHVKIWFS
jgi:hypothetical protein